MKSIIVSTAVAGLMVAGSAMAVDMPELAKKNKCTACHAIDKKVVGPSWMDVSKMYKGDAGAEAKLITKVSNGGSGVWGSMPEIANSRTVSDDDIKTLVKFVLTLNQPNNTPANDPTLNTPAEVLAGDPTTECITQIKSKKELQILNGKIELDGSVNYSFEQLANKSVSTDKEKKAISLWVSEYKRCKQLGYEWRGNKYPPMLIAAVDKLYADMTFLAADLYAKKISYGDFAKGMIKADQESNVNIAAAIQQSHQQQQAEQQQREALAQQQKNQQQQMQLQQQMQQQQYQQQQYQQQQYQQQQEEYQYQACMNRVNRVSDPMGESRCGMERAGRQLGSAIGGAMNK